MSFWFDNSEHAKLFHCPPRTFEVNTFFALGGSPKLELAEFFGFVAEPGLWKALLKRGKTPKVLPNRVITDNCKAANESVAVVENENSCFQSAHHDCARIGCWNTGGNIGSIACLSQTSDPTSIACVSLICSTTMCINRAKRERNCGGPQLSDVETTF